jgi:ABC-2 type transport system permease protein
VPGATPDTWVIFAEEFRGHLHSRWYQISTVVVVLLLIVAMFVVPALVGGEEGPDAGPGSEESVKHIGFVNESAQLTGLGAGGAVEFDDRGQGLQALERGDIKWLYAIKSAYLATGRVDQYGRFTGRFPSNPEGEALVRSLLIRGLMRDGVDPGITARVLAPADFENYQVADDGTISELPPTAQAVGGLLVPILFAGLLALGLSVGAGNMVRSVSEEKESRLVEVVITSVSPTSFMAGKLLGVLAVSLAQAAVWIITAAITIPVMFGRIPGFGGFTISAGLWLTIIGCLVTGYFLIATLSVLVGAVAPSSREATGYGGWLSIIEFVPIWFAGFLIWQPDGLLGRLLSYIPFTASSGILVRLGGGGQMSWWKISLSLAAVAVVAVVFLWVAIRIFRAAILMRGQSFTGGNLRKALNSSE